MELNIKNTTLYNKDLIIKYNRFFSRGYIKKNFIIIGIVSIGFIVYMLINQNWWYAALLLAIMIAYFLLTLLLQKFTIKRMLSKSPLVDNPVTQTYVFKKDRMMVTNNHKSYEVSYDHIKSVKNGGEFFLMKSSQNKSYIIDYSGFKTEEDLKELRRFFIIRFNMKE
ncbi:MAG TPA: YcxB family protein [Candidatus Izemoplasmatales bacterium]|nr:YcxB family protein [Candidatus Izemoplasmatales bacterium]